MNKQLITITDPSLFNETLAKLSEEQEYVIAIFTGVVDPETGKNWCPDCEVAKPNIQQHVINQAQGKVLYCVVDRASWKGTPLHPYKADHKLKVKGVPTILGILGGEDIIVRVEKDEEF